MTEFLDFTDMPPLNVGPGGSGLGQPWSNTNPAIASDVGAPGLPSMPNLFGGGAVSSGNPLKITVSPSMAGGAGSGGPAQSPAGGTTVAGQTGSDVAAGGAPGSVQNYFMRALVIITGFIFLAVGLNMLKPGVVPDPRGALPGRAT